MTATEAQPSTTPPFWSHAVGRVDLLVIAATIACALLTLWFASAPVTGTKRLMLLAILWPPVGVAWAFSVARAATHEASRLSAILLLVGFAATFLGFLPAAVTFVVGPGPAVIAVLLALALFAVILALERPRRIAWLVAPAIVLSSTGLAISEVPRSVRFTAAEPELTRFAMQTLDSASGDGAVAMEPASISGVEVRRAFVRGGCVHLVTAQVGFLGSGPAGLAYCPNGPATGPREYDPMSGSWYRWWRLVFFD